MIDVQNLNVKLGGNTIIDGCSFALQPGKVLAILGANGVGKTTLLNCLAGIRKPDSGQVTISGQMGYVPQLFHAAFAYSVIDVVLMGRARLIGLFGAPRQRDYQVARDCLNLLGIADLETRSFNALSGGQRQLVMIAQALSSECKLLVLDEPCSALDYRNQAKVVATLRELNQDLGMTIVFTTHDPQHALALASDVLLMKSGEERMYGTMGETLTTENLTALYGVEIEMARFPCGTSHTFAPRF